MSAESKAAILARERARRGEPEPKPKKAKKADAGDTPGVTEVPTAELGEGYVVSDAETVTDA